MMCPLLEGSSIGPRAECSILNMGYKWLPTLAQAHLCMLVSHCSLHCFLCPYLSNILSDVPELKLSSPWCLLQAFSVNPSLPLLTFWGKLSCSSQIRSGPLVEHGSFPWQHLLRMINYMWGHLLTLGHNIHPVKCLILKNVYMCVNPRNLYPDQAIKCFQHPRGPLPT